MATQHRHGGAANIEKDLNTSHMVFAQYMRCISCLSRISDDRKLVKEGSQRNPIHISFQLAEFQQ